MIGSVRLRAARTVPYEGVTMASRKTERINRLIDVLQHATSRVPASVLSKILGIGERSVRNYVSEVNEQGQFRIDSSSGGYRLVATDRSNDSAFHAEADGQTTSGSLEDLVQMQLRPLLPYQGVGTHLHIRSCRKPLHQREHHRGQRYTAGPQNASEVWAFNPYS